MTNPSIEKLASVFDAHGVRYTIIGGYALLLLGGVNTTQDIDLCVAQEHENLEKLAAALSELHPKTRSGATMRVDKFAFSSRFSTFFTDAGIIQVISRPQGFDSYEQIEEESTAIRLNQTVVRIASLSALKKMKSDSPREKDAEHLKLIDALERLRDDQA